MDFIGKLMQAEKIGMAIILSIISVNLIVNFIRTETNLDGINLVDYFGELDWKIDTDWENILMVLTLSIISMNLIGKLV